MTRHQIIQRPPDRERPMVVFHVTIDARAAAAAIELLFLNYPSREDLVAWCDEAILSEAQFMVERADLPEAWPEDRRVLRIDVPGLGGSLGRISMAREALIANRGRLEVKVRNST